MMLTNRLSLLIWALSFMAWLPLYGQNEAPNTERILLDGQWVRVLYEDGDTLIMLEMDSFQLTAPRSFSSDAERALYEKYRRYAAIVYPYAAKAVRIFAETEFVTRNMKKGQRKRHIKRLQKELKDEFQDPLKKLTKLQGYILVEMIEEERGQSLYDLIKSLRNGLNARYWQTLGTFYNYDLKDPYSPGKDPILDMVLTDFDVSYELPKFEEEVLYRE